MKWIRCPVCGNLFDPERTEAMPFCSRRCKLIDLKRWLNEEYGIPLPPEDEEDAEEHEPRESPFAED